MHSRQHIRGRSSAKSVARYSPWPPVFLPLPVSEAQIKSHLLKEALISPDKIRYCFNPAHAPSPELQRPRVPPGSSSGQGAPGGELCSCLCSGCCGPGTQGCSVLAPSESREPGSEEGGAQRTGKRPGRKGPHAHHLCAGAWDRGGPWEGTGLTQGVQEGAGAAWAGSPRSPSGAPSRRGP